MASIKEDCYWKLAYLAEATKQNNFHSKRQNEIKVTYRNWTWQFTSASVNLSGRNLQQKLWRLNWTNRFDRSKNQPHFPAVFTVL